MKANDIGPYFFLSHARTPSAPADRAESNRFVGKFYRDLNRGLAEFAGRVTGFMEERRVAPGVPLPEDVLRAVSSCKVLVPLYSDRYFADQACAVEWKLFTRRGESGAAPVLGSIVPAVWSPVDFSELPAEVRSVPFDPTEFGSAYADYGLYGLVRLSRFETEYHTAVRHLAERIAAAGSRSHLRSGWGGPAEVRPAAFTGSTTRPPLRLMVAARPRPGDSPLDWNPYHSRSGKPIVALASYLLANLKYQPKAVTFEEAAPGLLEETVPAGPGLLLVDPWALADPAVADGLRRFDELDRPWIRVMVLIGAGADRNSDSVTNLTRQVAAVFRNRFAAEERSSTKEALRGIVSVEEFEAILPHLVRIVSKQYLKKLTENLESVTQTAPSQAAEFPRPRLKGPALFNGDRDAEERHDRP
ncbi:TIR-like protein FxsC [Acrocarpospora catenulata]|uniref:TIR-like protein FxsC n=1 Tax=Acrocarpospora catenulata TaxID=2836182 RepID=UPI001BD9D966|nr:TIR-like protein FxsC [Acrocarpospora catenulata]